MEAIRKIIEDATPQIIIDLPEKYQHQRIEVIVRSLEEKEQQPGKYDFSDIIGKLQWTGDAVAEQRRLRDEWE